MAEIAGRIWKFGDNISADDVIIQYSQVPDLGSFDIAALKAMCFTVLRCDFPDIVRDGDIIVAGTNFGHHSHPHAAVAMKESGISAVFVESCDSAFIRKALNVGLPIVPCPGISNAFEEGQILETTLETGEVRNRDTGARLRYRPLHPQMIEVWQAGNLAAALRRRLSAGQEIKL